MDIRNSNFKITFANTALIGLLLSTSSCAWVSSLWNGSEPTVEEKQAPSQAASSSEQKELTEPAVSQAIQTPQQVAAVKPEGEQKNPSAKAYVELIWQVPGEPVETYHLAYGTDSEHLTNRLDIPVRALQKFEHPTYGPVFRYEFGGVVPGQTIFVVLTAENKFGISPMSRMLKISDGEVTEVAQGTASGSAGSNAR